MLFNKLKQKCYKAFEADESIVKEFVELNAKYWNHSQEERKEDSSKYIWIGLFMVEKWMSWMQPKFIFAEGLQDKYHCNTLVLDWEDNKELASLYKSYGFSFISVKIRMFKDPIGFLYGLCRALSFFIFGGTGKKLCSLKYKNRKIGQYIYDNTVRTNANIYTINNARTKVCFKKICTSYWFLHTLELIAKEYEPFIYLYDDLVYDEGMVVQLMHSKNARVMKCGVGAVFREIPWSDEPQYRSDIWRGIISDRLSSLTENEKQDIIVKVTNELEQRFKGENGDTREAEYIFKNKKELSSEEIKSEMGLNPNKKTVFIFTHCFSENPHKCSFQLYDDSYTWLEETMKIVREVDTVNWVIKGHPIAAIKYNEVGVLEHMYEKYKNENLYWFPNEYNSSLVTEIADAIITVYGTAGIEYSCLGIPVIHTGYAAYSNFGYTYFPQSIQEYTDLLKNISEINRLDEEQIKTARIVFSLYNQMRSRYFDEYDDQMNELNNLFYNDINEHKSFFEHNNTVFHEIMKYMDSHEIKNTKYYLKALEV